MRLSTAVLLAGVLIALPAAYAQDSIVGKYTGMMDVARASGGPVRHDTVYLVIHKVEAGVVEGTATLTQRGCAGDVPVRGRLEGNKLTLRRAEKAEGKADCGVNWELTVAGNKLEGQTKSGNSLRFSK